MTQNQVSQAPQADAQMESSKRVRLPLQRINFILMAVAGVMIVAGFLLMAGAPSSATEFNPDIFSSRRIVVGPTIAFLGFLFMGAAIMWPAKKKD